MQFSTYTTGATPISRYLSLPPTTFFGYGGGIFLGAFSRHICHKNIGSILGEAPRDAAANACATASHDRNLALECGCHSFTASAVTLVIYTATAIYSHGCRQLAGRAARMAAACTAAPPQSRWEVPRSDAESSIPCMVA